LIISVLVSSFSVDLFKKKITYFELVQENQLHICVNDHKILHFILKKTFEKFLQSSFRRSNKTFFFNKNEKRIVDGASFFTKIRSMASEPKRLESKLLSEPKRSELVNF